MNFTFGDFSNLEINKLLQQIKINDGTNLKINNGRKKLKIKRVKKLNMQHEVPPKYIYEEPQTIYEEPQTTYEEPQTTYEEPTKEVSSEHLYIFLSCKTRIDNCYDRIIKMMNNLNCYHFIIVVGGDEYEYYNKHTHILRLNCNDKYEGLPEKVIKTFKHVYYNMPQYKYICKLDDDVVIRNLLDDVYLYDYCGNVNNSWEGIRNWHIGRCSEDSHFNWNQYTGDYVPWCLGGCGYVVSKNSLQYIVEDTNYCDDVYEDVYIAKLLYKNNIFPQQIWNMTKYIYSKDHCK
jgi:hypothetical protein